MRIEEQIYLDFDDVLIKPKRSSLSTRKDIDVEREYFFLHSDNHWTGCPVIAANMSTTGTFAMAKVLGSMKMMTALHKFYDAGKLAKFFMENIDLWRYVFYTVGCTDQDFNKLKAVKELINDGCKQHDIVADSNHFPLYICLDAANGYTHYFEKRLRQLREEYPSSTIMCGNVVTPEMVQTLLEAGSDIIKIGTGGGSACLTRLITGVGVPQLTAIIQCADVAHGITTAKGRNGLICSDGGIVYPGDVAKAIAAGADFVMIGGYFAGTDECEGEWIEKEENEKIVKYLHFYGMSSKEAMDQFYGGMAEHRVSEGRSVYVQHKGNVKELAKIIQGGLRSCCTLVGSNNIRDLSKCCTFLKVNRTHNKVFEK